MQISELHQLPAEEIGQPSPLIEAETASRIGQEVVELARISLHSSVARTWDPTVPKVVREIGAKDIPTQQEAYVKAKRTVELASEQEHVSNIDKLTGLYNKDSFEPMLLTNISQAARRGVSLGIMIIDLNDFKPLNDTYGHEGGDKALKHVAQGIRDSIRRGETANRDGGDEFAVQLIDISEEDATEKALKIAERCARPIVLTHKDTQKAEPVSVDMSIGVNVLTPKEVAVYAYKFKVLSDIKRNLEANPEQNRVLITEIDELIDAEVSSIKNPADKKMYEDKANKGAGR